MRTLKSSVLLLLVAILVTGCGISMRVNGPFAGAGGFGGVEINNNTDAMFDVWVQSRHKGTVPAYGMGSFYFPRGENLLITLKAFSLDEKGEKKLYIGMVYRSFNISDRIEPWIVSYVQRPSSISGGGAGSGGGPGRSGGGGGGRSGGGGGGRSGGY